MAENPVGERGLIMSGAVPTKHLTNIAYYFRHDENMQDLFHYNEFSSSFEYSREFGWPEHCGVIEKGKRVEDEDLIYLQYYLAYNKKVEFPVEKIRNALIEKADRTRYHPVKEYLESLEWDGVSRINEWLVKACGANDNLYTRDIGRKWLMAAVARIYRPGYKFDYVLVLEGKENIGKSLALRTLGGCWFSDSIALTQKESDIVAKMVGNWIIEIAEMRGLSKAEQTFVKAFLSCQVDDQRFAYRHDPKKYPRQSIFAGTSNNMSYLLDADGNRRFWPIECTKIDIDWLRSNRDQLWAEAKHIYDTKGVYPVAEDGEKLFLTDEALELSKKSQKQRLGTDEAMEEMVYKFLIGKNEVTMLELLRDCFKYDSKDMSNRPQSMTLGRLLSKLGFEKTQRRGEDGSRFKYVRQDVVDQATEHGIPADAILQEEE